MSPDKDMGHRQPGDLEVLQRHPTVHLVTDHSVPVPGWLLRAERHRPLWLREMAAEAMGVFCYAFCGAGAFATLFFTNADLRWTVEKELNLGQLLTVGLGYALGIAFGLIVAATTSGGHLNPAVTLTFAITGRFPWRKVPQYWFAQIFGGFIAVIWVYGIWNQTFKQIATVFNAGGLPLVSATGPASVFVAIPVAGQNAGTLFATEFLVDMFLGMIIFAVLDPNNILIAPSSAPFVVGLAYAVMIWGFGLNTIATNLAKDLGGRLGSAIFFGREVFTTPVLPGYAALAILTNLPATVFGWFFYNFICGDANKLVQAGHGIDPELNRAFEQERANRRAQGLPAETNAQMVKRLTTGTGRETHSDSDKRS